MPKRKGKGLDRHAPRKPPCAPSAIPTVPSERGFEDLNVPVPRPVPKEPESSMPSQHSMSYASVLTRKSGRPNISRSEGEITDGAHGGASGVDKEKKRHVQMRMDHLPGTKKTLNKEAVECHDLEAAVVNKRSIELHETEMEWLQAEFQKMTKEKETLEADVKKRDEEQQAEIRQLQTELQRMTEEIQTLTADAKKTEKKQQAEIEHLWTESQRATGEKQTLEADVKKREKEHETEMKCLQAKLLRVAEEKRTLEIQKDAEIKEVKGKHEAFIKGRVGDLQKKDAVIQRLQKEIKDLNDALKDTRGEVKAVSQKERTAQQELARAKKNLQAASQLEKDLQHALSHLQVLHREAINGLNSDHQTQLQQLEKQLTQQIAGKLAADSEGKIQELEGERDRLSEQLTEVRQEQDNMRWALEKVRDVECERDQLAEQLKSVEQERKKVRGKLAKKCREVQAVQLEKEEMEKSLTDAQEQLIKEVEGSQTVKQQVEQQARALLERD